MSQVNISEQVIATISGAATVECYGLVGMAGRKIKDGLGQLLGKEDLTKGVEVVFEGEEVVIDLFVIVSYGVNIAEVAKNVIDKVKYQVEKQTGLRVKSVNINVQGVRVANS